MTVAVLAAHGQTPQSSHTTSAVEQLGLDDSAAGGTGTGRIRELRCRGKVGIDLRVDQDPSPRQPKLVAMTLRYERPERKRAFAQEGMGLVDYGVSIQNSPGSCTWNPGGFPDIPPEPGVVHFDLPRDGQAWQSPKDRDTTINAAVNFPDVVYLPRYLSDPDRYWVFYVDDVTGVAISYGAWPRGGGLPPSTAATEPTAHDPARPRDQRTTAAATRTPPSPAGSPDGPVRDASTVRAGSDQRSLGGRASSLPGAGAGGKVVDSSRSVVSVPSTREPSSPRDNRLSDARHDRELRLGSGIRGVAALPGPRGVRLVFDVDHARPSVQFSQRRPPWDEAQGIWAYPAGWDSPWYAEVRFNSRGPGYEAAPRHDLEAGVRYYYLITAYVTEGSPPIRQRIGSFTAGP